MRVSAFSTPPPLYSSVCRRMYIERRGWKGQGRGAAISMTERERKREEKQPCSAGEGGRE